MYLTLHFDARDDGCEFSLTAWEQTSSRGITGKTLWRRRGALVWDERPSNYRELLTLALQALQDRLGERKNLRVSRE